MIEWILSASVLILIVILLRFLLRGRISPSLQYALWGLVALRLLVPVSLGASPISVTNLLQDPPAVQQQTSTTQQTSPGTVEPVTPSPHSPTSAPAQPETTAPVQPGTITSTQPLSQTSALPLSQWLFFIWIGGMVLMALLLGVSNLYFTLRLRQNRQRMELSSPLPVYCSPVPETPCLTGLLSPAIYLTPQAAEDSTRQAHALAHEQTHYRQGDHLWSLLRCVCLVIHWYNPLVWLAAHLSRQDAELACDAKTLRQLGEEQRTAYGRTLVQLAATGTMHPLRTATTMSGRKGELEERIRRIARQPQTLRCSTAAIVAAALVAAGCTFTGPAAPAEDQLPDIRVDTQLVDTEVEAPPAVVEYAREYVQTMLEYYQELGQAPDAPGGNYRMTDAVITKLELVPTGTAGNDVSYNLYLLEYRLLADHPENIVLAGGMQMEDDWLTEWGSAGQPHLLLRHSSDETGEQWTPLGVVHTDRILQDYGTPEMLEKYGDPYIAAVMELAHKAQQPGDTLPVEDTLQQLFAAGESVTFQLVQEGYTPTTYILTDSWYQERFAVVLNTCIWQPLEKTPTQLPQEKFSLVLSSEDGTRRMTLWPQGDGLLLWEEEGSASWWQATSKQDPGQGSAIRELRMEYDNLEMDSSQLIFDAQGDASAVAETFVREVYGAQLLGLTPGNMYRALQYDVVDWTLEDVNPDGTAILARFEYAIIPEDFQSPGIWAGNTGNGTGKYEGWLTMSRQFILKKQEDGLWHCVGLGTGGYALLEE
ncbi:MAG: M56 family metallopeptidase [Eubacteriales bacterium]|jgi:beta-lactamase regulating signal transducer with metallopeptidase domain